MIKDLSALDNSYDKRTERILAARAMCRRPTDAERILWAILRDRQLSGLKFYRQRVIGSLIVDFYCASARFNVEVDGSIHKQQEEYDEIRIRKLEDLGYQVIRFGNDMVISDIESVVREIKNVALARVNDLTPIPTPETGEGAGGEVVDLSF